MSIERVAPERITVSTSEDALRITQAGKGNSFVVEDSENPDSTPFVIDSQGRVGIKKTPTLDLDVNGVVSVKNLVPGYKVTTTSTDTQVLTATSEQQQFFIGSQTEDLVLPVVSTLTLGQYFVVHNNSTGTVSVKSSGFDLVHTLPPATTAQYTCISLLGTSETSWDVDTVGQSAYETTATSGGTTTLDISSAERQYFTGSSNQTVVLPVASTLVVGEFYVITNNSTGTLTVQSSGGNTVETVPAGSTIQVTCVVASGTTASSWDSRFVGNSDITGTGSMVLSNSPALTGVPTAPTAAAGTSTTQIATTAFVATELSDLVGSSPELLNTLEELALALGEDANFSTTVTDALALKAPLASPALTGTPTAPTAAVDTNTTQIATTAFVVSQIADDAVLNTGDSMTGALNISVTSTSPALSVTQSGTGDVVKFTSSTGPTPLVIDNAGKIIIGRDTAASSIDGLTQVAVQLYGENTGNSSIAQFACLAGGNGPRHIFASSNGNVASPTSVEDGDELGQLTFNGFDGVDYTHTGAYINAVVEGAPANNVIPASLRFATNDTLTEPTERMRILPSGNIGIANSDDNAKLTVEATNGTAALALSTPTNATNAGSKIAFFAANRTDADEEMAAIVPLLVNNGGGSGNQQRGHLTFQTQGEERLRITDGGNVGINSAGPLVKLRVADDTDTDVVVQELYSDAPPSATQGKTTLALLKSNNYGGYVSGYLEQGVGSGLIISTLNAGNETERMKFTSIGHIEIDASVGINKDDPTAPLDVYTTAGGTTALIENAHPFGLGDGLRVVHAASNVNQAGDYTTSLIKTVYDTNNDGTGEASFAYIHLNDGVNENTGTATFWVRADGRAYFASSVGVGATPSGTYDLEVNGSFAATTKSFDIKHPTKEGHRLQHGVLEGPENGVYVRGKGVVNTPVELPDYWTGLVDGDSITVQVTAIGTPATLYVADISDNTVTIGGGEEGTQFFYFIQAERKDVDKLVVEYAS